MSSIVFSLAVTCQVLWSTCYWYLQDKATPAKQLQLLSGTSLVGLRLPLSTIAPTDILEQEAVVPLDYPSATPDLEPMQSAPNSIRVALSIEAQQGVVSIFLPPVAALRSFLDLIVAIEATAIETQIPIRLEGYTPPRDAVIQGFQITPDPGVIEANIHPAATWEELVEIITILDEEARNCRLTSEKFSLNGHRVSTGGGAHITIGGRTTLESPLLRRPDLLQSLLRYWQNHPSLSYLFAGTFVGPTSQAPRIDEARHDTLYELEIAFRELQSNQESPSWLVDRLLRNLLTDVTGNTHRAEFCIDKLFPVENPRNQFGLLEFRSFAMPPHTGMRLLQLLLIRACVAWFWQQPYTGALIRWGIALHDRFLLPHYLEQDLKAVLADLQTAGYPFEWEWFTPFLNFRFPHYGAITLQPEPGTSIQLELRHAIEPWHVLGEEVTNGRTARYVDDSMERLQITVTLAMPDVPVTSPYIVTCQHQPIPLQPTDVPGQYVAGVRFRARQAAAMLHPSITPHAPLAFHVLDTRTRRSLGGCIYHIQPPSSGWYAKFPINEQEAITRIQERFVPIPPSSDILEISPLAINLELPSTLDLRRVL